MATVGRRKLLRRGLLGGLLLSTAGLGWLASRRSTALAPPQPMETLGPKEYSTLVAVISVMCFSRAQSDQTAAMRDAAAADAILARMDVTAQEETRQLLRLLESAVTGFIFGGRTRPFAALPHDERWAVLNEWRRSRIAVRRTGYLALRSLAMAAHFSARERWRDVGYPGPPPDIHRPEAPEWRGD